MNLLAKIAEWFKPKPYKLPKTFDLRKLSCSEEKFDKEFFKGTIQGNSTVLWAISPKDFVIYKPEGTLSLELFQIKKCKQIKKERKLWLEWVPSKYCRICGNFFKAEALIEECPKCKVVS